MSTYCVDTAGFMRNWVLAHGCQAAVDLSPLQANLLQSEHPLLAASVCISYFLSVDLFGSLCYGDGMLRSSAVTDN